MAEEDKRPPIQTPVPDPTELTTKQIERGDKAERDYVDAKLDVIRARLNGMDEATKVLDETINRTPTDIQEAVGHLKELSNERLSSVQVQFKERDTRQERESRDNKVAVDAAFAAQKEAAAKQDESNQKAIDKSEKVTTDAINKLQDGFKTSNDALQAQINDLKLSQGRVDANKVGGQENSQNARANIALAISIVLFIFSAIGIGITISRIGG